MIGWGGFGGEPDLHEKGLDLVEHLESKGRDIHGDVAWLLEHDQKVVKEIEQELEAELEADLLADLSAVSGLIVSAENAMAGLDLNNSASTSDHICVFQVEDDSDEEKLELPWQTEGALVGAKEVESRDDEMTLPAVPRGLRVIPSQSDFFSDKPTDVDQADALNKRDVDEPTPAPFKTMRRSQTEA